MAEQSLSDRSAPSRAAEEEPILVDGNRLIIVSEGPRIRDAVLDLIGRARCSLRILYYIFSPDSSGQMVRDALVDALGRGVEVTLLVDDFGSDADAAFFLPLREAGGRLCRFHPSFGRRYLLRNHQKLLLADAGTSDARTLIGGFNIEDSYFGTIEEGAWRDLGMIVEGPAASRLSAYFDALFGWASAKGARIRDLRRLIRRFTETSGPLQWQLGGPTRSLSPWGVSACRDMAASSDLAMIAAYFSPTYGMRRRMGAVARRGRSRVVTASRSDNNATIAAARSTYGRLLRRGVEVFEYQATKLHTKLLVLDQLTHVGSANFDIRSMYLNLEIMLRVDDRAFADHARRYFDREIEDSIQITPQLYRRNATLFNRAKWALSFFLVSTMDYTVTRRLNFGPDGE